MRARFCGGVASGLRTVLCGQEDEDCGLIASNQSLPLPSIFSQIAANNKRKKSPGPKQARPKISDNVQLFAFDAAQGENSTGGRPKRKLKVIARYESMSFDSKAHCKIGQGFSCPRCSAVCSYDSHQCEECDLECCYEAGIGVVVLKERRASVEHVKHNKHATQEKAAGGANAASVTEQAGKSAVSAGTLTMKRVTTQRNKKRQSHPQVKMDDSNPTDENDVRILAQPAEGLPDGWVTRRIPRPSGGRKDPYWYSPKKKFKFRSKPEAQRFLASLRGENGDESAAMLLFKKHSGRGRRSSTGKASQNIDNIAQVKEQGETNELAVEEMGEAKMPAVENASSKMKSTENVASSEGHVHKSVEDSAHASKTKFVSDVTEAAMPNRAGDTTTSPMKKGVPPREEVGASPPHGNLSVRVQLYENELQTDHREGAETSNRKMSAQQGEANDLREKLKAATDSNSLQGTNNEMANLLREKEAALRAETIISTLRQEALSATNNIKRLSISNDVAELRNSKEVENNRVTSLESSLRMEQLTVQDLLRQLGNTENDIVKLTQQNKTINELNASLQCNLLGSQLATKEAQMAEARMVAAVARVTEEKARMNEAQLVRMADACAEARNDATTSDIHKKFVALVEAEARLLMQMEIQGSMLSRNMGVNDGVVGQQQGRHVCFGMPRDAGVSGMPRTPQDAAGRPGGPSDFFSQPAFMGQHSFPPGGAGTGAGAAGLSSSLQRQFMEQFRASMPRGAPGGGMTPPSPTAGATPASFGMAGAVAAGFGGNIGTKDMGMGAAAAGFPNQITHGHAHGWACQNDGRYDDAERYRRQQQK